MDKLEFNEQRVRDVEVPLFELDQRVLYLEEQCRNQLMDTEEKMCNKIDKNVSKFLPSISNKLEKMAQQIDLMDFRQQQQKAEQAQTSGNSGVGPSASKLEFDINMLKNEVQLIKHAFNAQKLKEIDSTQKTTERLSKEFEMFKIRCHKFVRRQDIDDLYKKIDAFVRIEEFNDIKKDMELTVNKAEFQALLQEARIFKKSINHFITKDEFMIRLTTLSGEIKVRLEERPTIQYLKKTLESFDKKLETMYQELTYRMDEVQTEVKNHDSELKMHSQQMNKLTDTMITKLSVDDGKRIWRYFQRFSEYEDLKELYKKTIPPLAKFEGRVQELTLAQEQFSTILRKFDEVLTRKVEKTKFHEFEVIVNNEYTKNEDHQMTVNQMEQMKEQNSLQMKDLDNRLKLMNSESNNKLHREVNRALSLIKGSAMDDSCDQDNLPVSENINRLLNRKIDKADFESIIQQKTNKKATVHTQQMIKGMQKFLNSLVYTLQHFIKNSYEKETMQNSQNKKQVELSILNQMNIICNKVQEMNCPLIEDIDDQIQANIKHFDSRKELSPRGQEQSNHHPQKEDDCQDDSNSVVSPANPIRNAKYLDPKDAKQLRATSKMKVKRTTHTNEQKTTIDMTKESSQSKINDVDQKVNRSISKGNLFLKIPKVNKRIRQLNNTSLDGIPAKLTGERINELRQSVMSPKINKRFEDMLSTDYRAYKSGNKGAIEDQHLFSPQAHRRFKKASAKNFTFEIDPYVTLQEPQSNQAFKQNNRLNTHVSPDKKKEEFSTTGMYLPGIYK